MQQIQSELAEAASTVIPFNIAHFFLHRKKDKVPTLNERLL